MATLKKIQDQFGNSVNLKFDDIRVTRNPTAEILIPEMMSLAEAQHHLRLLEASEEKKVAVVEEIDGFPLDAAHALQEAVSSMFGFRVMKDTPGGFFSPDQPPRFINVPTDHLGSTTEVFVGRFTLPSLHEDSYLETMPKGNEALRLQGVIKSRERGLVQKLAALTRQILAGHSLYQSKAIRLQVERDPDTNRPIIQTPQFIDTTLTDRLVLRKNLEDLLRCGVLNFITRSEEFRRRGMNTKRGTLFYGAPGTGKTLAAKEIAAAAVENGFTFITSRCEFIPLLYRFAKKYSKPNGAVLFLEDMDLAVTDSAEINSDIQNVLDGVDTKDSNVIVVFTTNYIDRIPKVLLRQGRMDVVIPFELPDAEAAARLVLQYGGRDIDRDRFDAAKVGAALKGQTPASINEVLKRAKSNAMDRLPRGSDAQLKLATEDLLITADSIRYHNDLLNPPQAGLEAAKEIIVGALNTTFSAARKAVDHVGNGVDGTPVASA